MKSVIDILKEKRGFLFGKGVADESISKAEKELGVIFSDSYKAYLREYGIAAFSGHELTGISKSDRTNVVNVTLKERETNNAVPKTFYVIEQTNIEGIVIWQTSTGEIYRTDPMSEPKKVYDSLEEFLVG